MGVQVAEPFTVYTPHLPACSLGDEGAESVTDPPGLRCPDKGAHLLSFLVPDPRPSTGEFREIRTPVFRRPQEFGASPKVPTEV